ncbi:14 kDa phosphohistidine phosphatase [Chelonoidis abingdonii]|uniref:14 kDa phosphohistidine phosphatase n=1 Tax=Chelonoidis abingdonii TaxID=106734 RepID=UPI003F499EF2
MSDSCPPPCGALGAAPGGLGLGALRHSAQTGGTVSQDSWGPHLASPQTPPGPVPPLPRPCVNVGRVAGSWQAAASADIYDKTAAEIEKQGYDCECLGGGRISHQSKEKKIHVYGYSVGFGRAKHSVSTKILKDEYPDYAVTWADEGY